MVGRRCGPAHRVPSEPTARSRFLPAWLPPSSHAIPAQGKAGTNAYANRYQNRYQWEGSSATAPPELRCLVANPRNVLAASSGLGLAGEIIKYAEVAALLGGETAIQGATPPTSCSSASHPDRRCWACRTRSTAT